MRECPARVRHVAAAGRTGLRRLWVSRALQPLSRTPKNRLRKNTVAAQTALPSKQAALSSRQTALPSKQTALSSKQAALPSKQAALASEQAQSKTRVSPHSILGCSVEGVTICHSHGRAPHSPG